MLHVDGAEPKRPSSPARYADWMNRLVSLQISKMHHFVPHPAWTASCFLSYTTLADEDGDGVSTTY